MNFILGILLVIAGGAIQGAFVYPMKLMKNWKWENGWFIFTLTCCLIFPLALAFSTTPGLLEIYQQTDPEILWLVFISGMAWGIGVILFGLGAEYLGMALGIAIITALNSAFGTLLPILFLPSDSFSFNALLLLGLGLIVLMLGVSKVAKAGKIREDEHASIFGQNSRKVSFRVGLLVCIAASIFCPATNFAVFFGQPITESVKALNTVAEYNVGYAQLLPYFLGGFIVNAAYCIYLFYKNKSFGNYRLQYVKNNLILGIGMSVLFIFGMVLYTIALTTYLTKIGAVVGWPLFMAATIISANLLGVFSGEWKNVSKLAFNKLYSGMALLILAITLVSISNIF